jgi:hypothetical protein
VKKPVDPKRQLSVRDRLALLRRINSPVIVPANDPRRAGAAMRAWINNIFRYLDIDPSSPGRWERAFYYLAQRAYPDFRLIQSAPVGRQKATAKKAKLLTEFEGYQTRKRGSKYKHFLTDHAAVCGAAGIKTIPGLRAAIGKAKREREVERETLEFHRAIEAIQAQAQLAGPVKSAAQSPTKSDAK